MSANEEISDSREQDIDEGEDIEDGGKLYLFLSI